MDSKIKMIQKTVYIYIFVVFTVVAYLSSCDEKAVNLLYELT